MLNTYNMKQLIEKIFITLIILSLILSNLGRRVEAQGQNSPDFSIFVNCVTLNGDGTFTAYYGYLNRNESAEQLSQSRFHPGSVGGTPLQVLLPGRHDFAFTVTASVGQNVVWIAKSGSKTKTSTASSNYTKCVFPEEQEDDEEICSNPLYKLTDNTIWAVDDEPAKLHYYKIDDEDSLVHIEGEIKGITGEKDIEDLAIDEEGNIWIVNNVGTSKIYKISPSQIDGNAQTPVRATYVGDTERPAGSSAEEITALFFHNSNFYGISKKSKKLYSIDRETGSLERLAMLKFNGGPKNIGHRTDGVAVIGDQVYVGNTGDDKNSSQIYKFDGFPSQDLQYVTTIEGSGKVEALTSNGEFLYAAQNDKWYRINVNSGESNVILEYDSDIEGMDFFMQGEIAKEDETLCSTTGVTPEKVADFYTLGPWDGNGKPEYLISRDDEISSGLIEDINRSLPERETLINSHPEYLADADDASLILEEDCEIWVTFVDEGADWNNTLGYYTYPTLNPPDSVSEILDRTIIYPRIQRMTNVLQAGNKVQLLYLDPSSMEFSTTFPAGYSVGWFLIAKGWRNSTVTNGSYIHYSNVGFNVESSTELQKHNVLLWDDNRGVLVIGFEDIRRDSNSCDNDFNDALFYATVSPITAVDNSKYQDVDDSDEGDGESGGGSGGTEGEGGDEDGSGEDQDEGTGSEGSEDGEDSGEGNNEGDGSEDTGDEGDSDTDGTGDEDGGEGSGGTEDEGDSEDSGDGDTGGSEDEEVTGEEDSGDTGGDGSEDTGDEADSGTDSSGDEDGGDMEGDGTEDTGDEDTGSSEEDETIDENDDGIITEEEQKEPEEVVTPEKEVNEKEETNLPYNFDSANPDDVEDVPYEIPVFEVPVTGDEIIESVRNPALVENVTFSKPVIQANPNSCTVNVEQSIKTESEINSVQYSLDNGSSWYSLESNGKVLSFETVELEDRNYKYLLKVQTKNGRIFTSNTREFISRCRGEKVILDMFLRNGTGKALVEDGEIVYNPSLPMIMYVETIGGFEKLKLKIEDVNSDRENELNFNYDFKDGIWMLEVDPNKVFENSSWKVVGDKDVAKDGPNVRKITEENSVEKKYIYDIYYKKRDSWQNYNYKENSSSTQRGVANQGFNLEKGEYLISVQYPNGSLYWTNSIKLDDFSVVKVNTDSIDYERPKIFNIFARVSVETYENKSREVKKVDKEIRDNIEFLEVADVENSLVTYWNRWSPLYNQSLDVLNRLQKEHDLNVYILVDKKNHEELINSINSRNYNMNVVVLECSEIDGLTDLFNGVPTFLLESDGDYYKVYLQSSYRDINDQVNNILEEK